MPHKEIRKLIKIGGGSLGLTLPKPWCRYFKLNEMDTVEMISNGKIVITPIKTEKTKVLDVKGGGDSR
jgi:bifunctional DNA-binding transcriptional regulator/antitoxin component of YhaV-PrlF toxin-antitoxin module